MNNIDEIKSEIKRIQKNFNPEKATYKILNDILTEDYSTEEILAYLMEIKGVEKYPEELKKDFIGIVKGLKTLSKKEEKKDEEERIAQQEENTRELKAIIDALESKKEEKKEVPKEELKKEIIKEESKQEEPEETLEELDSEEEFVNSENTLPALIFKIVLIIVILCILLAIGLVLFY